MLTDGGFETATPLWYYVLKEAEVLANGNSLGPVGSRIVAETLIGQLRADPQSFLNVAGRLDPRPGRPPAGRLADRVDQRPVPVRGRGVAGTAAHAAGAAPSAAPVPVP